MSFSNEAHVAYVSDAIEVSQPRFVSCSAKRRAERDSCVSFSEEKGHVFLAEPQRAGEILAYPFPKKKATFPVFLPRPEEVSGREFTYPFQHRKAASCCVPDPE